MTEQGSYLEGQSLVSEPQVLSRDKSREEDIDSLSHAERHRDNAVCSGHTIQCADKVGQVIQHSKIVLNANHKLLDVQNGSDHPACSAQQPTGTAQQSLGS